MRRFTDLFQPPNPSLHPTIRDHRLKQRRPFLSNPFEPDNSPAEEHGLPAIDSPSVTEAQTPRSDGPRLDDIKESGEEVLIKNKEENPDIERGDQIPEWLNLDFGSFTAFFVLVWWMWVSQLSYNINFYTDDWFHLFCIFLQLVTFGSLAATTKDFDITNYIEQSPGEESIESYDLTTMSPERFKAERLAKVSFQVIALTFALSRVLLLIQYMKVLVCAKRKSKSGSIPVWFFLIPASLFISTGLFFGAYDVTRRRSGRMPSGAGLKFGLWGLGLLIEMLAHAWQFQMPIKGWVRLRSHGSIAKRLNDITTIILGEGLNAIAGVLYSIIQATGIGKSMGPSIASCGIIIFLLAYLYFEGPAPPKPIRRRVLSIIAHFLWLLSIILLLESVKNQLLLIGFIDANNYFLSEIHNVPAGLNETEFNRTMIPVYLQAGLTLDGQAEAYLTLWPPDRDIPRYQNMTEEQIINETGDVWRARMLLSVSFSYYRNFMNNDTIPESINLQFKRYQTDYNYTLHDLLPEVQNGSKDTTYYNAILKDLLDPTFKNTRFIMTLCGATFILLATLNLLRSFPRDRFQWFSIISRFAMGVVMLLLYLLNIGQIQSYFIWNDSEERRRAGVFRWIDAHAVLPTLAGAYLLQFLIDSLLLVRAVKLSNAAEASAQQAEKQAEKQA
ncbi:Transmembrane protein [Ceratobasidium theobromae]|uniref:Transmembrane protein n=1 Tax=Ceratobasidium theobromae TaxID=1582974 RepID=A0A5N5QAD1_9AGAM|nr:Transmembrane protein [Ceratobasidium theobromae]